MGRYLGRFRLLVVAGVATLGAGCATWEDYRDSSGAGKAVAEVAVFKANVADTRRIVNADDGRTEYQSDAAPKGGLRSASHLRIRLLPGQYTVTAKTWPFGSVYEFDVDLKAGHTYKVETSLCSLKCLSAGTPNRHDRWIEDMTTRERVSAVVSECYFAKQRSGQRRRVPCPEVEPNEFSSAGNPGAAVAAGEEDNRVPRSLGKAKAVVAVDEEDYSESRKAGEGSAAVASEEEDYRDPRSSGKAQPVMSVVEEEYREFRNAGEGNAAMASEEEDYRDPRGSGKAQPVVAVVEEDYRESRSAGEGSAAVAIAEVAVFKVHPARTRRIVNAADGRVEYHHDRNKKQTQRSGPSSSIRLQPGQYTITAETWPFGSLYEFEVELQAGHTYQVETSLCSLKCITSGEPNRHDRWVQDLTAGERISAVVSECYLGKRRGRDRQKVPCPDS
ncbi:MAG: hypothetical protein QNJ82_00055 [Gammaproteobacteria bacterium]|nr:hypothetical protein [Gammaproteobacteria bacterium]